MTVRTLSAQELDSFAAPHAAEWVKEMSPRFWQDGRSSPEQCFHAEVDRLNAPMRAALERAGYKETGPLWNYRLNL